MKLISKLRRWNSPVLDKELSISSVKFSPDDELVVVLVDLAGASSNQFRLVVKPLKFLIIHEEFEDYDGLIEAHPGGSTFIATGPDIENVSSSPMVKNFSEHYLVAGCDSNIHIWSEEEPSFSYCMTVD